MEKVYLGTIVSTHGIKGEIKIRSNFPYKEKAFLVGSWLFIDQKKYQITSYRRHKDYEMICLAGYDNINDVLFLMKKDVYKEKSELGLQRTEILDEELITYKILTEDEKCGIIKEIFYGSKENKILRVDLAGREVLIPWNSPVIQKIDYSLKEITVKLMTGM